MLGCAAELLQCPERGEAGWFVGGQVEHSGIWGEEELLPKIKGLSGGRGSILYMCIIYIALLLSLVLCGSEESTWSENIQIPQ